MAITYREGTDLPPDDLGGLYAAVGWEWMAPIAARILAGTTWAVSAWDDGRLVGFARALSDDVCESVLHNVCVHPEYQGLGIGAGIMDRVVARFGHTRILLTRRPHLDAFYTRYGFQPIDHAMERRYVIQESDRSGEPPGAERVLPAL